MQKSTRSQSPAPVIQPKSADSAPDSVRAMSIVTALSSLLTSTMASFTVHIARRLPFFNFGLLAVFSGVSILVGGIAAVGASDVYQRLPEQAMRASLVKAEILTMLPVLLSAVVPNEMLTWQNARWAVATPLALAAVEWAGLAFTRPSASSDTISRLNQCLDHIQKNDQILTEQVGLALRLIRSNVAGAQIAAVEVEDSEAKGDDTPRLVK